MRRGYTRIELIAAAVMVGILMSLVVAIIDAVAEAPGTMSCVVLGILLLLMVASIAGLAHAERSSIRFQAWLQETWSKGDPK